ncbi:MAG: family 78 glycoside hydrolase catalytic domain [Candidatus Bathyarchaeia archaeon]
MEVKLRVVDTRVEFAKNPLGISEAKPRFSWVPQHTMRGQFQKSFRVIVSSNYENALSGVGDVWDSGVVESESNVVEYRGPPLKSFTRYFWRVKWWDSDGRESCWSDVASFETAILNQSEWKGMWIGGGQFIRKNFHVTSEVLYARAYIAGLGYYELRINGVKVGDKALDPLWSEYDKRVYYSVYDVTEIIGKGENVVAVVLGRGRYAQRFERGFLKVRYYDEPKVIFLLRLKLTDGKIIEVFSDETWKCLDKPPIISDDIYDGFKYDARLEPIGWDRPGFDDSSWQNCSRVTAPSGILVSSASIPATKAIAIIKPKKTYNPKPNVYVFDFGQNITGWVRIRVRGSSGQEVKIRYAETIKKDYTLNTMNLGAAEATDIFILRGDSLEILDPKFTYHGFRYVEVSGITYPPSLDDIEAVIVHAELEPSGSFMCSNELINDIHRLTIWSLKGNLTNGVQTDCPQRAERMGWLGDIWLSAEAAILNFNMIKYYEKIVYDIIDSQKDDGSIPDVVPPYWQLYPADPAWGTALIYVPWLIYLYYGNKRILEESYIYMKRWWYFLYSMSKDDILYFGKYGDWVPPGRVRSIENCPLELIGTWILYRDAKILARIAKILGANEDALFFEKKVATIGDAFNKAFLHDVTGPFRDPGYYSKYAAPNGSTEFLGGSQTSNSLPLAEDIVPKEKEATILQSLIKSIEYWDKHLNVGILGAKYVPEVLVKYGHMQLAYETVTQETYPSYGYMIKEDATTLWERWEKLTGTGMNSHNHHMFGSIDAWFYKKLAGIEVVEPGFKRFIVNPPLIEGLNHASAYLYTIRGLTAVMWSKDEKVFRVNVTVPVGSIADIYLPRIGRNVEVYEGGKLVWRAGTQSKTEGLLSLREENDRIVVQVSSGNYNLEVKAID